MGEPAKYQTNQALTTYKISNSNGLSGVAWDHDYETQDEAAEAIRTAYGWDEVVLSDSYSVGNDYGTGDADAVSAYETQEECDADQDGAHAPRIVEIVKPGVRCECGEWCGERCEWTGPKADTVRVEWMPEQHRASHEAARNRGTYPHNGAIRLRVSAECADHMVEADGEWVTRI
jgi:hypothetical protein